jgi:hypothetical protein
MALDVVRLHWRACFGHHLQLQNQKISAAVFEHRIAAPLHSFGTSANSHDDPTA